MNQEKLKSVLTYVKRTGRFYWATKRKGQIVATELRRGKGIVWRAA